MSSRAFQIAWMAAILLLAPAAAPQIVRAESVSQVEAALEARRRAALDRAVEVLVRDSALLVEYKPDGTAPCLRRPHRDLGDLNAEMVEDVLDRMLKPLTGDLYRDSYIRWHLMWVVRQASQPQLRAMSAKLKALVDQMPLDVSRPGVPVRETVKYVPPGDGEQRYRRYHELSGAGRLTVGVPPFERVIGPPESFEYMPPEQVAAVQAMLTEAEKLAGTFQRVVTRDEHARAFNGRIGFVNGAIRQFRGELIYALLWTGDSVMVHHVMTAIDRHARARNGIALTLLNFLYQAAFDGALELYDARVCMRMGRQLEATARTVEGWKDYGRGHRNFADYAFHMVHMLQDETLYRGTGQMHRQ